MMDLDRRYAWGFEGGVKARQLGHPRFSNPFVSAPSMPMRVAWFEGFDYQDALANGVTGLEEATDD